MKFLKDYIHTGSNCLCIVNPEYFQTIPNQWSESILEMQFLSFDAVLVGRFSAL